MLIQMSVAGMILEGDEKSFFLLLREIDGETIVSIEIDQFQAEYIAIAMESPYTRIPDPYDFITSIVDSFDIRISKIIIKNRKFFTKNAEVFLTNGEREIRIYAYAGDAVISALLVDAPIFIKSDFMGASYKKALKKWLSKVKPSDFEDII